MPTVVSESLQITEDVFLEYKETWATPYYSGSELLALQNYYIYPPGEKTIANTIEPFLASVTVERMFEVIYEFNHNVISSSFLVSQSNTLPGVQPPI